PGAAQGLRPLPPPAAGPARRRPGPRRAGRADPGPRPGARTGGAGGRRAARSAGGPGRAGAATGGAAEAGGPRRPGGRGPAGPEGAARLRRLLELELELRGAAGEAPALTEYLDRFPGHEGLVRAAFANAARSGVPGAPGARQAGETPPALAAPDAPAEGAGSG